MSAPQQLSWENFRATVLLRGEQRVHRVTDSPRIEIIGDGVTNRIGMLLEIDSEGSIPPELSKLAFISTRTFNNLGSCFLEVATARASIHRQFYNFAVAVAERIVTEKRPASEAIGLELQCFADLLEEKALLGIERQLGLIGELMFLERLVKKSGLDALDSWLGPIGEPHDFRIQAHEFEVKTTVSTHRIHTIHGMEQLIPSEGCSLHLISLLLGPAGASDGLSLAEMVERLDVEFATSSSRHAQYTTALAATGFKVVDGEHYSRRFALRRPMGLVRVDSTFPSINRVSIQRLLGPLASRVEALQYDVSVEGLEHEDGTTEFESALPV